MDLPKPITPTPVGQRRIRVLNAVAITAPIIAILLVLGFIFFWK